MSIETLLTIVGFFGTIALSINAFFLRGIHKDLNEVKISQAIIIENSDNKEKRISELESEIDSLREKFHTMNTELHQLKSYELLNRSEN